MTESASRSTQSATQSPRGSPQETAITTALADADRLAEVVKNLKAELRSYGEPGTTGRDTMALRTWFEQMHRLELAIARSMNIDWSPT